MEFTKKRFGELAAAMMADVTVRTPELTDFNEGSVARTLLEAFAYEVAVLYEQMDRVYQSGFVDTARGVHLDRVVGVLGITRTEADYPTGEVTFQRDPAVRDAILIPQGLEVATADDPARTPRQKVYVTTQEGTLLPNFNELTLPVRGVVRGRDLVTAAESAVGMLRPLPGVKSIVNRAPIRFLGEDRETDEALRARAKQELLASGRASRGAIENALLKLPEVREVWVQEDFRPRAQGGLGPGVVEIYVDALTSTNSKQVREALDQVRAAGIYALLKPAVLVRVDVRARIEVARDIGGAARLEVRGNVARALSDFLGEQRLGQALRVAKLIAAIVDVPGVADLVDLKLETYRETAGGNDRFAHPADVKNLAADVWERFAPGECSVALTEANVVKAPEAEASRGSR